MSIFKMEGKKIMKYTYEEVKNILKSYELELLENTYINCKQNLLCIDKDGYYVYVNMDHLLNRGYNARKYHSSNKYTIHNINRYAKLHNINSRCISENYNGAKDKLTYACECGCTFNTTLGNFMIFHKTRCNNCTKNNRDLSYDEVYNNLYKHGFILDTAKNDYLGITLTPLICHDSNGYKYDITYNAVMKNKYPDKFNKSNPYVIHNINTYLQLNYLKFKCISKTYSDNKCLLEFICLKCGKHIFSKWCNIYRNDNASRSHLICSKCGGRTESLHALVLKQMFLHEYPDTIVEERSCINPSTNKIMPTDIVNHKLKIAIEIQSQFHDFPDRKIKDKIKKDFWISKGYKFYAPDIRDYSIIEMCKIFFDINDIPPYIDFDYSNKLNIRQIQKLLNDGLIATQIANKLNINVHRIYDAVYSGKLQYKQKTIL